MNKAPRINWQTVVDVKSDILFMSLNSLGLKRKYVKKALDIDYEYKTLYHFENTVAYSSDDLGNFFNLVQKKLIEDKNYIYQFPKRVYVLADNLLNYSKKIVAIKYFNKYSNEQLESLFSTYIEKAATAFPLLVISIPIEVVITGELEKFVRDKLKERAEVDKFEEYFQALTQFSEKETFFQMDYRNLLRIGAIIQNDADTPKNFLVKQPRTIVKYLKNDKQNIYDLLLDHNERYSWINMYCFRRHPFTIEELVARMKDVLEKDCNNELKRLNFKKEATKEAFRNAIKILVIKGELKKKLEMLPEYVFIRTYRLDIFTLSAYRIRGLLSEIKKRLGLDYDQLIHMTLWEISSALKGELRVSSIPIEARMRNYATIQIDGNFEVIVDEKRLHKLHDLKTKKKVKEIKEFRGSVASRGKAKGPVKIVMHSTQITKIEKGDVLVAPMTSPDFVVGMLKVVAIVTDHGGITSHAAIVSRELGLPCIVGTKIATKVLRDGDFVEVDAEKGVIRRVEKT